MNSYPSSGDELFRLLRHLQDKIRRLERRDAELSRELSDLEARVAALEGP